MENLGYLLYLAMVAIMVWMWFRVRGMTLEEIVAQSSDEHHALVEIFEHHPHGGNWTDFSEWVDRQHH